MKFRICIFILSILTFLGCQNLQVRSSAKSPKSSTSLPSGQPKGAQADTPMDEDTEVEPTSDQRALPEEPTLPVVSIKKGSVPQLGIILGPGSFRAFAHIGFLKALQNQRFQIKGVGGLEWGAISAALYSQKGSVNDVEWQMFKMPFSEFESGSLLNQKKLGFDEGSFKKYLKLIFASEVADRSTLKFGCPTFSSQTGTFLMMNKGQLATLADWCAPYPPAVRSYSGQLAALREVSMLATYLRQQGAEYIILVNVLPKGPVFDKMTNLSEPEKLAWKEVAALMNKPFVGVNETFTLELGKASILDYDQLRGLVQQSQEQSTKYLEKLTNKLGY